MHDMYLLEYICILYSRCIGKKRTCGGAAWQCRWHDWDGGGCMHRVHVHASNGGCYAYVHGWAIHWHGGETAGPMVTVVAAALMQRHPSCYAL